MRDFFGFDHDLDERLAHARFIASRTQSFSQAAEVFAGIFRKQLTDADAASWSEWWRTSRKPKNPREADAAIEDLNYLVGLARPPGAPFHSL